MKRDDRFSIGSLLLYLIEELEEQGIDVLSMTNEDAGRLKSARRSKFFHYSLDRIFTIMNDLGYDVSINVSKKADSEAKIKLNLTCDD